MGFGHTDGLGAGDWLGPRGCAGVKGQDPVGELDRGRPGLPRCCPLDHIGEAPGEVDQKRFERQPAATGAVSEWLQAPPRQMWQRCHETVSEGWPPLADDESDGGLAR